MKEIEWDVALNKYRKADAVIGDTAFELKDAGKGILPLTTGLLQVSQYARLIAGRGVLILTNSGLSAKRVEAEWQSFLNIIDRSLAPRLALVLYYDKEKFLVFGQLTALEQHHLHELANHSSSLPSSQSSPASSDFELLRILLIHWFRKSGPLKIKTLCAHSGYSYPTVTKALNNLEQHLMRHSDRRVQLAHFPKEEWTKLMANAPENRVSQGFYVPDGKPRSIDSLISRLLFHNDLAIAAGGIIGARHDLPGIDLVGIPRLDITWQEPTQDQIFSLIRSLDPALKPAKPGTVPQVVVHQIHRPKSFFRETTAKNSIADEVEALLDLHEAKLNAQAAELLNHLIARAKS